MTSGMLKRLDYTRELEFLSEVSELLTQFDMNRTLGKIIRRTANAVGASRAHLALHPNFEVDWRQIFLTDRLDPDRVFTADVGGLDSGLAGRVAREGKGMVVTDVNASEYRDLFDNDLRGAKSALAVPFIYNQDMMAVLTMYHPKAGHFTENQLRLVQIVTNQTAVAIHNARLENHVRSGQYQFEAVLHAVESIMLVLDSSGKVLMMNAAGTQFLDIPESRVSEGLYLRELAKSDTTFDQVQRIVENPDGERHWVFKARSERLKRDFDALVSVWENPLQAQSGYVVIMHDVTTLLELDRFKNDMLRMASHDLRTPLALITGYASIIELDLPAEPPGPRAHLANILKTVERMNNLLDDLLRFQKVQTSPLELHEPVQVVRLLKTVMEHSEETASSKQHQLTTDYHDLPTGIIADPVMVREAMENLVNNAIKYTPDGGKITVRAFAKDNRFYFEVEDNGFGLSPEHLPRLFTSFYRAKQTGTERIEGTGVGLSLVKTIVDRHQGDVWVESEPEKGSKFGFWLPIG
jgi:signal transduction histidine kinase